MGGGMISLTHSSDERVTQPVHDSIAKQDVGMVCEGVAVITGKYTAEQQTVSG